MSKIDKEQQKAFEKSLKWLSTKQRFTLFWWSLFFKRRAIKYIENLQQGMGAFYAFNEANKMK